MIDRRGFARLVSLAATAAAVTPAARARPTRKIIKPKRLSAGDTVGLVLPASAAFEADSVHFAKEQLEAIGLKVKIGEGAVE